MSFDSLYSSEDLIELEFLETTYSSEDLKSIDSIESEYYRKDGNDQLEGSRSLNESENSLHNNRNLDGSVDTETLNVLLDTGTEENINCNSRNGSKILDETTNSNGPASTVGASNGNSLQTEITKSSQNETRKRKMTADTSDESGEGPKSRKDRMTSIEHMERKVYCSGVQQQSSANMQRMSNTSENNLTADVETDADMNSTSSSLPRANSIGYPLKKSQDDTLSKSMLDSLSVQMDSVGILIAHAREVGTVFRVGSKYLMTAHHVVKDLAGLTMDDSVYVTFHESVLDLQRKAYHTQKIVFWDQDLDVAVLELANSSNAFPPKMQLSKDDISSLNVNEVSLIGYGHPHESNLKKVDPRCKLISPQSLRFVDAHKWLDENEQYLKRTLKVMEKDPEIVNKGYAGYTDDHKIIFDCYMQQGASGSPALAYNNYGQMKVVGILTHGLPEFYFLMPKILQHSVDNNYRFEVGSRMSSIYNCILNADKDLARDLFE